MPSKSKAQQKFMGAVYALKKGDIKPSDVTPAVRKVAKDMKKSDAKDFASTKHKGLPKKVKQEILNKLKEYANKMGTDHLGGDDYTSKRKGGLRDFDGYDNVDYNKDMPMDEATKGDIMRAVKGKPNPYTLVVIKRGKVIYQKDIKNPQDAPAIYSVIRKYMDKGERIHIEDRTGKIVFKESKLPNNWMSGRTSDYHTKLRGKKRDYDDTNFDKEDSGQPDLENEYASKLTLSYLPTDDLDEGTMIRLAGNIAQELLPKNTFSRFANDGKKNKEFVKSVIRDLAQTLNKFYKSHKIDVRIKENKIELDEIGIFPIQNYVKGIIPGDFINSTTPQNKERLRSTLRDLKNTLNKFWKQHKIPYRVR